MTYLVPAWPFKCYSTTHPSWIALFQNTSRSRQPNSSAPRNLSIWAALPEKYLGNWNRYARSLQPRAHSLDLDLPVLPDTDRRTKKHLVRLFIEEIVASVPNDRDIELLIHWKGGRHTRLLTPRNRTGQHRRCTDRGVVDVVRDLARRVPDAQIARILNRLGYRTGADNSWTQQRVVSLRHAHDIPVYTPSPEGSAVLTIAQAASALGVSTTTVRNLHRVRLAPRDSIGPLCPWAIRREDWTARGSNTCSTRSSLANGFRELHRRLSCLS